MPKFFINNENLNGTATPIVNENAKHIGSVLRDKIGD